MRKLLAPYTRRFSDLLESQISWISEQQLSDGGIRAYHIDDDSSGVWITAEFVHILSKIESYEADGSILSKASRYIKERQNKDGGWPFRSPGKSITDITSWACLALSHFDSEGSVKDGISYILTSAVNTDGSDDGGWGLTEYEPDRIYSTWIAIYALIRASGCSDSLERRERALDFIRRSMNGDGGWGPLPGKLSKSSSTAAALLALFMAGEDPRNFESSLNFILGEQVDGVWSMETEIVVTREGYELPQEWFTSALCFRCLIFFMEMEMVEFKEVHKAAIGLESLIHPDGSVQPGPSASHRFVWPSLYLVDCLDKFLVYIKNHKKVVFNFIEKKNKEEEEVAKKKIEELLRSDFPYPLSDLYFAFKSELDYHTRFHLLIQVAEATMKYTTTVMLSSLLAAHVVPPGLKQQLRDCYERPSMGHWLMLLRSAAKSEDCVRLLGAEIGDALLRPALVEGLPSIGQFSVLRFLEDVVHLRNTWSGHGAVRSAFEYKEAVAEREDLLLALFSRLEFLAHGNSFLILNSDYDEFGDGDRYQIRIFNGNKVSDEDLETSIRLSEGHRENLIKYIYFQNVDSNFIVNLYPFITYTTCAECKRDRFLFYNGTSGDSDSCKYISFQCGHATVVRSGGHLQLRLKRAGVLDLEEIN